MPETTDQFEEFAVNCNPASSEVFPYVGKGETKGHAQAMLYRIRAAHFAGKA